MNLYLIALCVGGTMEITGWHYRDFEVIKAKSRKEAVNKYNKKNNCSYFYGCCMAEKVDGKINIVDSDVTYAQVELLNEFKID